MQSQHSIQLDESRQSNSENLMNNQQQESVGISRLSTLIQKNFDKKQLLGVNFSGIIKSATFKNTTSLNVLYALKAGNDWEILGGQASGISQRGICDENKIVWNFPFGVTYQSKNITGWPQIYVVLYRTDYFGRSMAQAYGNVHLPRSDGKQIRKMKVFKPIQPKSCWNCLNFCTASLFEIKQPEKSLSQSKNKTSLTVEYYGQIQIQTQVKRINFQKQGYE